MKTYYKPSIKSIIDKKEEAIPQGYYCNENSTIGGTECPFLQFRKMTKSRLNKVTPFIPYGNTRLQYCSYLKKYLSIQDCVKDCNINEGE